MAFQPFDMILGHYHMYENYEAFSGGSFLSREEAKNNTRLEKDNKENIP